jgi:hypothetical protein
MTDELSPNKKIDTALDRLLKKDTLEAEPVDVQIKVINAAVAWEKVKHGIKDKEAGYDPDNL